MNVIVIVNPLGDLGEQNVGTTTTNERAAEIAREMLGPGAEWVRETWIHDLPRAGPVRMRLRVPPLEEPAA